MEALKEALKELARVALMAAVPMLILQVQDGKLDLKILGVVIILATLRFADKWLHNVSTEDGWLKKQGLVGF